MSKLTLQVQWELLQLPGLQSN